MKKQEQLFIDSITDRATEEHKGEMSALLQEIVQRKQRGGLDKAYLAGVMPRLFSYLNPDKVAEVKEIIEAYAK